MSFEKLRILVWKNWTLQRRRPIAGCFQILFPIAVVVAIVWGRNAIGNQIGAFEGTQEEEYSLRNFSACTVNDDRPLRKIFFTPDDTHYETLIRNSFNWSDFTYEGFENETSLNKAMFEEDVQVAGITLTSESPVSFYQLSLFSTANTPSI